MNAHSKIALGLALAATTTFAAPARAATEIYTNRAAFEARLVDINATLATLPGEAESFEESIPGSDPATRSGPATYTHAGTGVTVSAGGFGVFSDDFSTSGGSPTDGVRALGYQGNGTPDEPLVIELPVPVNAVGFDIVGFGSSDLDPFSLFDPGPYSLLFTGGALVGAIVDVENSAGNGDPQNTQFYGIIDLDSPFTQVELQNTGFFDSNLGDPTGLLPDEGDTVNVDDLVFGVATFAPLCGDVDGNRQVTAADATALSEYLAGLDPSLPAQDNCSVRGGADDCDIADLVVLRRAVELPQAAPGTNEVCRAANPAPERFARLLRAYWSFDEDDGFAWNRATTGLTINASLAGDGTRTTGKLGQGALDLPDVGVEGYAAVTDPVGQGKLQASTELTISGWIRPSGPGGSISLGGTILSNAGQYDLNRLPGGELRWQRAWGEGPIDIEAGTTTAIAPIGEWTHVAVVFDTSEARVYVNGLLDSTTAITEGFGDFASSQEFRIGSAPTAAGRNFEGAIDELAVWVRALDETEVGFLYGGGFGRRALDGGVVAANFDYGSGNTWFVTESGAAPRNLTTDTVNLGDIAVRVNGADISRDAGVVIATVRENRTGSAGNLRLAEVHNNGDSALVIGITTLDGGAIEANARVSAAYFPFADGWIGGHVAGNGTLERGSGTTQANVQRQGTGLYRVTIPGVADSFSEGILFAVGGNNEDNLANTNPLGGDAWQIRNYDNDNNFGEGQDVDFSFVYIPYAAANLVAAEIDSGANVVHSTGFFGVDNTSSGITEISIPGEHYRRGVLLLEAALTNDGPQDNLYTYTPAGSGRFISQSHDLPAGGLQQAMFSFAYISMSRPPVMP